MRPLLDVRGLKVAYGHFRVVNDVDLAVSPGEAVALVGTNGAGKSTLLRAVAGLLPVQAGQVRLDGADVTGWPAHRRARAGLTLVEGGRATFPSLTVRESLTVGVYPLLRRDPAQVRERTDAALALFPELVPLLARRAGALSGGEQQMLALARAAMARPRLLCIDELSLGLAPVVLQRLLDAVADLLQHGTTMLLVEQSLNVAAAIADTAYFMEKGEVLFRGDPTGLLERGDLVRSVFLGRAAVR